ncbi:hypothetical protein ACFC6L_13100 [Kitasatospora phosalacinea]|uniref:hypothetical protein n=1 Tax=Kitasatospora phosalacinea TaxID=2065 RepID=UPI0035D66D2D
MVGCGILAFGLATGALPGLVAGAALAASRTGAPTRRWRLRGALTTGAAFFLEHLAVAGATNGRAFLAPAVIGTPVAVVVAALAAGTTARLAGPYAWVGPEQATRLALIARGTARRRAVNP